MEIFINDRLQAHRLNPKTMEDLVFQWGLTPLCHVFLDVEVGFVGTALDLVSISQSFKCM